MKFIDWLFKYRHFIAFCSWVLGLIIIVIDLEFVSHVYGNTFQWVVAFSCLFVSATAEYCTVNKECKHLDEPTTKK